MTFIERRKPRSFRILYMPFSRFWDRYVLGQQTICEPPMERPSDEPEPARTPARGSDIPAFLLHGPEALRRRGGRRP